MSPADGLDGENMAKTREYLVRGIAETSLIWRL